MFYSKHLIKNCCKLISPYRYQHTLIRRLPNGLRIATYSKPASPLTAVSVFLNAGSRWENQETNGVAHFLEHMLFKRAIEEGIENLGGHLNAYTSREQTVFQAQIFNEHLPEVIDILHDILVNSKLDHRAIEHERHVILKELEEVSKNTDEVLFDVLHQTAYQNSPLGNTILGHPENILTISRNDLLTYMKSKYTPENMVIVGVGSIDSEKFCDLIEKYFGKMENSVSTNYKVLEPANFTEGFLFKESFHKDLSHCAIGFKAASSLDPYQLAFMLLEQILKPDSLKMLKLSNKDKTLENLNDDSLLSFYAPYIDTGLFGAFLCAPDPHIKDLLENYLSMLKQLPNALTNEIVHSAKQRLKTSFYNVYNSNEALADELGRQITLYNRSMPLNEIFERIEAIDLTHLNHIIAKFILPDKNIGPNALAGLGNLELLKNLKTNVSCVT